MPEPCRRKKTCTKRRASIQSLVGWTPEQKKSLVEGLQAKGHKVAMTGDGVNDILALKTADCSIAMESGNDATKKMAQVVLLDSDFGKMPSIVAEGRRVVNNIQRSASLFF